MWQQIMISVISSLVGAGGVGAVVLFGLSRMYGRIDRLEKDVTDLENQRISSLEDDLKDHVKNDRTQEIMTEIRGLKADRAQDSITLQSVSKEQSRQGQAIKNIDNYVRIQFEIFKADKAQNSIALQGLSKEQSRQAQALLNIDDYARNQHDGIKKIREDIKELMKK